MVVQAVVLEPRRLVGRLVGLEARLVVGRSLGLVAVASVAVVRDDGLRLVPAATLGLLVGRPLELVGLAELVELGRLVGLVALVGLGRLDLAAVLGLV